MAEHSRYQQNVIKNYYENRENIALQRAQELVTELYLTCLLYTSPSPRDRG